MATGKIDAQEIGNGSGPVTLTKQSAAKAIVNYDQTTTSTIRYSMNITSIVDISTGNSTHNITSAFVDGNLPVAGLCDNAGIPTHATSPTASTINIATITTSASGFDYDNVGILVHGDLA